MLESDAQVKGYISAIRAVLETNLDPNDTMRRDYSSKLVELEKVQLNAWNQDHTQELGHPAVGLQSLRLAQRALRRFRNLLGLAAVAMVVLLLLVGVTHTVPPSLHLDLCCASSGDAQGQEGWRSDTAVFAPLAPNGPAGLTSSRSR